MTEQKENKGSYPSAAVQSVNQEKFLYVLLALVSVFFILPLLSGILSGAGLFFHRIVYLIVFACVLYAATSTIQSRRTLSVVLILSTVAVGLNMVHVWSSNIPCLIGHHLIFSCLLGAYIFWLMHYLFRREKVTSYTIYAALSAYLMFALMFSLLYGLVDMLHPGSFSFPEMVESQSFTSVNTSQFLYYSFVTITTLGYGDISPLSSPARVLSTAEAFIGEMFVAIMIARLIGMHITAKRAENK
jgi:hypothetical protein